VATFGFGFGILAAANIPELKMSDSFDRSKPTRTQTINVSNSHVLAGFNEAIESAITDAGTALSYSHALADMNIEEAQRAFRLLADMAQVGIESCERRRKLTESSEPLVGNVNDTGEFVETDTADEDPSPLLLSIDDSARFLNISREQLIGLMDDSEFAAEYIDSELRLNIRDLDDYLQRNGAGRAPTPASGTPVAVASGLADLHDDDFESIISRLFDSE
jgi:hypothetical protein